MLASTCLAAAPSFAQTFVPEGAAPGNGTGVSDPYSFQTFTGATSAIFVNPTDGTTVLGSVNGGIWTAPSVSSSAVTWTARSDNLAGLSIAALAADPSNPLNMIAGVGAISNGGLTTGPLTGLMTSNNGGTSWSASAVAGLPVNYSVTAAAIYGNNMLAGSSDLGSGASTSAVGLYQSKNAGAFTNIAADLTGQANSPVTAIVRGIANNVFVAAGGGSSGVAPSIYKGTVDGSAWTSVVAPGSALALELSTQSKYVDETTPTNRYDTVLRLAAGTDNTVVAAVIRLSLDGSTKGKLQSVYYSPDNGANWYKVPLTGTDGKPLEIITGGQALTNLSIAVDLKDKKTIYLAGDSSDTSTRVNAFYLPIFKLTLNSTYSSATVTDLGVLGNTYIHADSRGIAFDKDGNLVVLTDGGIYTVASSTGTWRGVNSNLQIGEYYQVGYDARNHIIGAAAQDNGVQLQRTSKSTTFNLLSGGDGLNISFADKAGPDTFVYGSTQNLGGLSRARIDSTTKALTDSATLILFDGQT